MLESNSVRIRTQLLKKEFLAACCEKVLGNCRSRGGNGSTDEEVSEEKILRLQEGNLIPFIYNLRS